MLLHALTNYEIPWYYHNWPGFNGVYSPVNILDKISDGVYVINLDEYADIGTHWITLYSNVNTITYFDRFGVEQIPKGIKRLIEGSTVTTNICRIKAYDSVMCGYFCIRFIDFMGKILTDFTNLSSPNNFEDNDKTILKNINNG